MRTHLRMKKFAAVPAALVLAFGVAACEGDDDTTVVEDEPDTVVEGDDGEGEGADVDVDADVDADAEASEEDGGEAEADAEADAEATESEEG